MIPTIQVMLPVVDEASGLRGSLPATISSQCATCRNWTRGFQCRAFPGGIPDAILSGGHDHTRPFPGDDGIRFDPVP